MYKTIIPLLIMSVGAPVVGQESSRVELELLMDSSSASTTSQQWMNLLKDVVPNGLRIRQGTAGEKPEVIRSGNDKSPLFRVIGLITREGLILPNGQTYTMSDKRAIAAWLAKVPEMSNNEPGSGPAAFGLTENQLVSVHEAISAPVSFSTKGLASTEAITKLTGSWKSASSKSDSWKYPLDVSPAARASFASDDPVLDELEGVSGGTALAAILRPLGLVFAPQKVAGSRSKSDIAIRVADARELEQSWPIGWPIEKQTSQVAPELFKFLNVDITDTPLDEALTAIQSRVKYPFLRDHNSIVRQRIDLHQVRVNLPGGKTYYKSILDKVLNQGKMKCEIRMDEAEKPFVWITTTKK